MGSSAWEAGWALSEVVQDYQILRLVLIDYLEETLERMLHSREMMAVSLAIDESIAASVGCYVKHRDEMQQRQTEALQEAHRRKDEFLALLGHELRNPLAPLRNARANSGPSGQGPRNGRVVAGPDGPTGGSSLAYAR